MQQVSPWDDVHDTLPLRKSLNYDFMITVLFFASLREQLGQRRLELTFTEPLSLKALASILEEQHKVSLSGSLMAINEAYAAADATVTAGDTVAFFPPVSGG